MKNGIINVYKEAGYTSHDVVAKLRGIFGQKKIGHTGTLDPDAVGVLPVCLGKATKVCGLLTEKEKGYRCILRLGLETDTQDLSGAVRKERPVEATEEQVRAAILRFVGPYSQLPPMYSAVKVQGKRLYELARAGKVVAREPRSVEIFAIAIEAIALPTVTMEVICSKGTYIRTLCHDIGQMLGCGGCMEHLTRTRSGDFLLTDSHTLSEIEALVKAGQGDGLLQPVDTVFLRYPKAVADRSCQKLLENGNRIPFSALRFEDSTKSVCSAKDGGAKEQAAGGIEVPKTEEGAENWVRLYDANGRFAGIYCRQEIQAELKPVKIFLEKD